MPSRRRPDTNPSPGSASTRTSLVALLAAPPELADLDLEFARDRSLPRPVDPGLEIDPSDPGRSEDLPS